MILPGTSSTPGMFYGPPRVWLKNKQVPGLAMTRSIGDMAAGSVGVTAEPEIKMVSNLTADDKFLVVASDGIFDRFTNEEITQIIGHKFYPENDSSGACNYLVQESAARWEREQGMIDDITVIVAFLQTGQSV